MARTSFALILLLLFHSVSASTYYVSNDGDDANSGLDASAPWRTVAKVNSTLFAPGSQILFERGGQWRESLMASSSGAAGQPIVYDAYGAGPKPRFWGSDILDKSLFQPLAGSASAFSMPIGNAFNVLLDHQFAHSAELITGTDNPSTNIAYVSSNPNSWYFGNGQLYLNTGGVNPASDSRLYTAVTREDVVHSFVKHDLVFRNLVTDESARYNGGYGFRIESSDNVMIESSEAYRAGKHHFGVINSNGFVGQNLYSAIAMPDQGYGGASAYVSFSDQQRHSDTSTWINAVAEDPNGPYAGFISHGQGMGDILIRNMVLRGVVASQILTEGQNQKIRVEGGVIEGVVQIGSNVTIDGLTVSGPTGSIDMLGVNDIVQNTLLIGRETNWQSGNRAAITDNGINNTIRFNTIILGPQSGGGGTGIAINRSFSNTKIYGNVFADPHAIALYAGSSPIDSHDNLFASDALFGVFQGGTLVYRTLAQWQGMGLDMSSLAENIIFQNPQRGDYALAGDSSGIDYFTDALLSPGFDLRGFPRPISIGADIGAFERPFAGDANFDGTIDADDYALIDAAFASQNQNAGFANGDFDFSGGPPNPDDYFIIDLAFAAQNGLLSVQSNSVPEPAALSLMAIAALFSLRCRRHDRSAHRQR